MNTLQIKNALVENDVTNESFRGVFAADQVPWSLSPFPGSCVVNTDGSGDSGAHWIGMYQDRNDVIETFDSYGKDFGSYSPHLRTLVDSFSNCIMQSQQLQSNFSTVCGQFSMFFLLHRCLGESYEEILHLFTENRESNDRMVCQYVNFYFDLKTPILDKTFFSQVAKKITELK